MNGVFETRPFSLELHDDSYIAASFFKSWRNFGKGYASRVPYDVYKEGMGARIKRLMSRSTMVISHVAGVPTEIAGWVMFEGDCLHFVKVKAWAKGQGIARHLTSLGDFKYHSHETHCFQPTTIYNPFLAERP